jgi:hypothetical protein
MQATYGYISVRKELFYDLAMGQKWLGKFVKILGRYILEQWLFDSA